MTTYVPPSLAVPVRDDDHVRGFPNAPVTLLEYGDFECPHCGAAHPVVEAVRGRMGRDLRFVYRHFPLATIHPRAEAAAEVAEAAGVQGRFWEMHDLLFEHQGAFEDADFVAYAETLGLDVERFVEELRKGIHSPRVRRDFMSGVRSGVNGTPTFFINGVRHDGEHDLRSLLAAAQRALAQI